ncbi:MAG: phosphoribosyl-AMP cyclohydrolase [Nitriliruptoraceae bacterium]
MEQQPGGDQRGSNESDPLPVASGCTDVATIDDVSFDGAGLAAAIVVQHDSHEVLMVAWMNREALEATLRTGETVFWSRSRQELWHKGATSGNTQRVIGIALDCDGDALLIHVDQGEGVACHTGQRTCFHRALSMSQGTP